MRLLEREPQLASLGGLFERASRGAGACAILFGEAGVGKTALIRQFIDQLPAGTPRLVAGCEALFVPRPMGPFVDLAEQWPPGIALALREGRPYPGLYADLAAYLAQKPSAPKVLVLEDLHWADAGTLDCVRYLGRRVAATGALVVLSFRSGDVSADHPLNVTLADLPSQDAQRIEVPCLSRDAVTLLARYAGRSALGVYEATAGNSFFVTEVLGSQPGTVPGSIRDAVLARLMRLGAPTRAVAELVAVSPTAMERALVEALVDGAGPLLDECIEHHLLVAAGSRICFRHDLARQAVAGSLPANRAAQLHRRVFEALRQRPLVPLQRLVHHAELAGLSDQVLALAPDAARSAARMSAHREAAELYSRALEHAASLPATEHADLLEAAAHEFDLIGAGSDYMKATTEALALRRQTQDSMRVGINLRRLAFGHHTLHGDRAQAQAAIIGAVECLSRCHPSVELALALAQLSRMQSSWSEYDTSVQTGDRALALAEALGDAPCLVEALHASASARMFVRDDTRARANLARALSMALDSGLEDTAARLYRTLQMVSVIYRHHAYALDIAEQGVGYCEARDLDLHRAHLLENRALSEFELGRWSDADRTLAGCLAVPNLSPLLLSSIHYLRARIAARRGDPASHDYWRELRAAPDALPMGYRVPAIAAACAEAAWLQGDADAARSVAALGAHVAVEQSEARLLGPLLVWLRRLDATPQAAGVPPHELPPHDLPPHDLPSHDLPSHDLPSHDLPSHDLPIAAEHALELAGDLRGAAARWAEHGCVYERALVLLHGDEPQLREALDVLVALGAAPAADIARTKLRSLGARGVQRGPQPRTRDDPDGLTPRERRIYALICEGLSNAAIAARLHRSERTVENHVANTLAKLGARTRTELLVRARQSQETDNTSG
jgi:DNA-binding CsgD family transcriptional regulator/tetratricopeptide (TPR) repeat protein